MCLGAGTLHGLLDVAPGSLLPFYHKPEPPPPSLGTLPDAIRTALALDGRMRELAGQLREEQSLLVFGRGYNFATALEAALKVKEVALMHRWAGRRREGQGRRARTHTPHPALSPAW